MMAEIPQVILKTGLNARHDVLRVRLPRLPILNKTHFNMAMNDRCLIDGHRSWLVCEHQPHSVWLLVNKIFSRVPE